MKTWQKLTIYIDESDRWHNQPLYMALVEQARRNGLAGAVVQRGIEGFGSHQTIHTTSLMALATDLPIEIKIIDTGEAIAQFLPQVQDMVQEGLVTLEDVQVVVAIPRRKNQTNL